MKVQARDVERHLRALDPAIRVALIYGPDTGLVTERAKHLCQQMLDDADDPFRLVQLTPEALRENPTRLIDEAQAISMFGGRRVIRLRGAGNAQSKSLEPLLDADTICEALVVVEAGALGPRDTLRKLCESAPLALALPCYADGPRELEALIRQVAEHHSITIEPDAFALLLEQLGEDRLASRQELDKLCLYVGSGGTVDRRAVLESTSDGTVATDDVVQAVFSGDSEAVDPLYRQALAAGETPVGLLRALLRQALRLAELSAQMAEGASASEVVKAARPPLYGPMQQRVLRQLDLWSPVRLDQVILRLESTEVACKSTGIPDISLLGRTMIQLSRAAAGQRNRRRKGY